MTTNLRRRHHWDVQYHGRQTAIRFETYATIYNYRVEGLDSAGAPIGWRVDVEMPESPSWLEVVQNQFIAYLGEAIRNEFNLNEGDTLRVIQDRIKNAANSFVYESRT